MSYGANQAVDDAADEYREKYAQLIARIAAELVAARDMGRQEALAQATEWVRNEQEADGDATGVVAIENTFPSASKVQPSAQVAAIAIELLEAARNSADTL